MKMPSFKLTGNTQAGKKELAGMTLANIIVTICLIATIVFVLILFLPGQWNTIKGWTHHSAKETEKVLEAVAAKIEPETVDKDALIKELRQQKIELAKLAAVGSGSEAVKPSESLATAKPIIIMDKREVRPVINEDRVLNPGEEIHLFLDTYRTFTVQVESGGDSAVIVQDGNGDEFIPGVVPKGITPYVRIKARDPHAYVRLLLNVTDSPEYQRTSMVQN